VAATGSWWSRPRADDGVPATAEEAVSRHGDAGRVGRRVGDGRLAVATLLTTTVCALGRSILHVSAVRRRAAALGGVRLDSLAVAAVVAVVVAAGAGATAGGSPAARPAVRGADERGPRLGEGDFSVRAPRSGLEEADRHRGGARRDRRAARPRGRAQRRRSPSDASHQLRTPLTALRLQLESLELPGHLAGDAAGRHLAAAAFAEADRLEATIAELSALTRLDAPEVAVDLGRPGVRTAGLVARGGARMETAP
jgi:signal transduction histidine kinase